MQYQFTERQEFIKTIEFANSNPLLNVQRITYFKEEEISGSFSKKEFRYSFDNAVWTNWNTLTQGNLAGIAYSDNPKFYLQLKYSRNGIGNANILRWYLFYESSTPTPPVPPHTLIDADLLQGEPGSYYLDRSNQIGPYTGINVSNVAQDPSAAGVYYGRLDTSLGTDLYFKRIEGGDGVTISDSPAGIITIAIDPSSASSGTYESSLDSSISMPTSLGGIPAGTKVSDLNGDTLSSLWDALLFPTAYPSLNPPSGSFSVNVGNLFEVSTNMSLSFTAGFNRGSISPQYNATSPFRSGIATTYHYTGFGLIDGPSSQIVSNYSIRLGTQTWTTNISYAIGVQPYDSKGNIYNSPYPAGSLSGGSITIEGAYPLYGTTASIGTLTKQNLVSMISSNAIEFSMVAESGGNKQTFEIPNAWSRSLISVETFDTVSNTWKYEGGSAAQSLLRWTLGSDNHVIQGNTITYKKYTYNSTDRSAIRIRLNF